MLEPQLGNIINWEKGYQYENIGINMEMKDLSWNHLHRVGNITMIKISFYRPISKRRFQIKTYGSKLIPMIPS